MILAICIALLAWGLAFILPWWSVFIPGLIFGTLLGKSGWRALGWGFIGIGGLWLVQSLYIHIATQGILTTRMAHLFRVPHPFFVLIITIFIGGMIGGFTTLTGYLFQKLIHHFNMV